MPKLGYVDWRKPNNLLAHELGVTGEAVRQMRAKRNAPAPVFTHLQKALMHQCWAIWEKRKVIAGLPRQLAEKHLGFLLKGRLLRFAKMHAGVIAYARYPWELMNWELPTVDLARIWGMKKFQVQVHRLHTTNSPDRNGIRIRRWTRGTRTTETRSRRKRKRQTESSPVNSAIQRESEKTKTFLVMTYRIIEDVEQRQQPTSATFHSAVSFHCPQPPAAARRAKQISSSRPAHVELLRLRRATRHAE
jgi:hypothetical protein